VDRRDGGSAGERILASSSSSRAWENPRTDPCAKEECIFRMSFTICPPPKRVALSGASAL